MESIHDRFQYLLELEKLDDCCCREMVRAGSW